MLIIDGDGHIMEEPNDIWTPERIDHDRWGDWVPRKEVDDEIYEITYIGGVVRGGGRELHDQMAAAVGMTPREFYDLLAGLRRPGGHEPEAPRIADLDADGIDAVVLYPSLAMFFGPVDEIPALHDTEFVADCHPRVQRLARRLLRVRSRHRLFGVAAVPLQDVDARGARRSSTRAARGLKGVFVRPSAYVDELPLNHHVYDDFWSDVRSASACRSRSIPACTSTRRARAASSGSSRSSENTTITNMAMDEIHGGSALGQAVGNAVDMIVTMGRLLMGGVCERFPTLKLVFLESSGGWVPSMLERMDEQVRGVPAREALALAVAERVLRAAVLRELRARGVEPRGRGREARHRPHPLGVATTRIPSTTRASSTSSATRIDKLPRRRSGAHPRHQRDRLLPPAARLTRAGRGPTSLPHRDGPRASARSRNHSSAAGA